MRFIPRIVLWVLLVFPVNSYAGSDRPLRIISMSPHYTAILFDMGAGKQLVGVTNYCRFPLEARSIDKVGGFLDPNIEKVVRLKPDLILMLKAHGAKIETFRQMGFKVLVMDNNRLSDVFKAYDQIGSALGMERQALIARKRLQNRLAVVKSRTSSHTTQTALFVAGKDPGVLRNIYAVGPGTFLDEIMNIAGLRNMLSDSRVRYPLVSKEAIVRRDPDIILEGAPEGRNPKILATEELKSWREWGFLKAVKTDQVHVILNVEWLVPGPGLADLAEYMSNL